LRSSWRQKVSGGFFLRAETFFNFATYLEDVDSSFMAYGGKSLHRQSHGEAFLSLFQHRFEDGLYLLDEPEAALSPQRQLAFLRILHDLTAQKIAQFVIATHSPMLLTFPGATIFSLDAEQIRPVTYQETDHFQITRDFLNAPERYYRHLLEEGTEYSRGAARSRRLRAIHAYAGTQHARKAAAICPERGSSATAAIRKEPLCRVPPPHVYWIVISLHPQRRRRYGVR
jgi:hypothetical protein